jgi:hypothetical protein
MTGAKKLLFTAPLPIERAKADRGALYVECGTDPMRPGSQSFIFRVPKDGSAAVPLHSIQPAPLDQRFISDGRSLFVRSFATASWIEEIVSLGGGPPRRLSCGEEMPFLVESDVSYSFEDKWVYRTPAGGGARVPFVETPSIPAFVDDGAAYVLLYDNVLQAFPEGGPALGLGDFGDDDSTGCRPCGQWRDALCLRCSGPAASIYRVPKRPRPRGHMIAWKGGRGLALDRDYVYWQRGRLLERLKRNLPAADTLYEQHYEAILADGAAVESESRPIVEGGVAYYASHDGGFFSVPVSGGAASLLYRRKPFPNPPPLWGRLPRLIASAGDDLYFLDESGDVVRVPRAGGSAVLLASAIPNAREILADERALYVVAELPRDASGTTKGDRILMLDRATGAERQRRDFQGTQVHDVAATRAALYVSVEEGALYRIPKDGSSEQTVFAKVPQEGFMWRTLDVGALTATGDRLYFTTKSRVFELRDGAKWPTVLATGFGVSAVDLVADDATVFVSTAEQGKGEHWTEVGRVPLQGHEPVKNVASSTVRAMRARLD